MDVTYFLLLNGLGLIFTAQAVIADCSRPVGGPNMDLKAEDILLQSFPEGTKVNFGCNVGYMSVGGSGSTTCTAGTWSPVALKCEKKNCGPAEEVENGEIDYSEGTEFGAKIVVTCKSGYSLVGKKEPREIFCGDQGWSDRMPVCEVVTCEPPRELTDGTFIPIKDVYSYGEVVQYRCNGDLTLIGTKSTSCSDDGVFLPPDPPKCIKVQCPDLDIPNADWIRGSRPPYGYKATVTYKCRTGYIMKGESTQICEADNQWSPGLPTCQPVTCNPPPVVVNGTFSPIKESYDYSDVVQYSCKNGFKHSGSKSASCSDDGTFMLDSPPKCTIVTCNPPVVANGVVSPTKDFYSYGDVVKFSCQIGFTLTGSGSKSTSCSDDGTFKPAPPTCTIVTCNPPVVANGALNPTKDFYSYGDVVKFSCQTGFALSGSKSISCSDDGTFKPDPPKCAMVTCNQLPVVANAALNPTKDFYSYGDVVEYSCRTGFALNGSKSISCSDDGTFKPDPPKCTRMTTTTKPTTTTTTTTETPGNKGNSVLVPIVIVVVVILCGLVIICAIYYFGFPGFIKGKRRKRRSPVGATLMDVKRTGC